MSDRSKTGDSTRRIGPLRRDARLGAPWITSKCSRGQRTGDGVDEVSEEKEKE